jgi:hypothetical protein
MTAVGLEVRVRRHPAGAVSTDDFEVVEVPTPEPGAGQVLVRNPWTSVDPGLRLRLRPDSPAGYFVAFQGPAYSGLHVVDALEGGETVWVSAVRRGEGLT